MNRDALAKVIELLERTVGAKDTFTCKQFLTVLYCAHSGGLTQVELAEKLGGSEGAISHNYKVLGPEGSGCLTKDGKLIKADPHVIDALTEILKIF